ncbi:hypothetical protein MBLNU230_g0809t1 [Neophaeotheca triangularis]
MAFQQPQQRRSAVTAQPIAVPSQPVQRDPQTQTRTRQPEESQEWILFSPAQQADSSTQTSQTPRTATHLSDFGSLETHIRSQQEDTEGGDTCQGTEVEDDATELDSLDDGLHAFHQPSWGSSPQLDQSGGSVLPAHDGLGGFPSTFASAGLQEQLWQFERYNPHRRRSVRRRSSVQIQLDAMAEDVEERGEVMDERTARIEKWRMDQSRAVLEELEKEARRRRRRMSRMSGASGSSMDITPVTTHQSAVVAQSTIPEESEPETTATSVRQEPGESFWQRITRRVMQDLMGLDETTLSVIFGEQLVDDSSPTPTQPSPIAQAAAANDSRVSFHDPSYAWENKVLERIARELGVFLPQVTFDEGAFSTYSRYQQEPEYAGLPLLRPESPQRQRRHPSPTTNRKRRLSDRERSEATTSSALFDPTLPQQSPSEVDTSLWGIEEEPSKPVPEATPNSDDQDPAYWQRDLDLRMIFDYLKRRFSRNPAPQEASPADGPLPASWATEAASPTPPQLSRADLIRRQHPLVSRAAEHAAAAHTRRRESLLRKHHLQTLLQRQRTGSSSCASQSDANTNKRSRRAERSGSVSVSRVSSRNYWDLGGSFGSESVGVVSSGAGGWGDI